MEKQIGNVDIYIGVGKHMFYLLPSIWIEKYKGEAPSMGADWLWFHFMISKTWDDGPF